jgi:hypothetical protein
MAASPIDGVYQPGPIPVVRGATNAGALGILLRPSVARREIRWPADRPMPHANGASGGLFAAINIYEAQTMRGVGKRMMKRPPQDRMFACSSMTSSAKFHGRIIT